MRPEESIRIVKEKTKEIILFHSGTGKDSIALLNMLSPNFNRVVCVFMYMVKGLDYENRYIDWALKNYSNIEFYKTPHFCLNSFIKNGHLGIAKNKDIQNNSIRKIDELVKSKYNILWSSYGFKKNDGITRRLMLNGYKENICDKTHKLYPLRDLSNSDIINYINDNNLIPPFNYDHSKPSSGCDVSNPVFLDYIRTKYPSDLGKIFNQFPYCESILFRYDNYGKI